MHDAAIDETAPQKPLPSGFDETRFQKFSEYFKNQLEELVTNPKNGYGNPEAIMRQFKFGRKLPGDRWISDRVVRCGQDLRMTPEEIKIALQMWM